MLLIYTYYNLFEVSSMDPNNIKYLLIIGGNGEIGKSIIKLFRNDSTITWKICIIDCNRNDEADKTIQIKIEKFTETTIKQIKKELEAFNKLYDGIITLSGSWVGGSIKNTEIFEQSDKMFSHNYYTALVDFY